MGREFSSEISIWTSLGDGSEKVATKQQLREQRHQAGDRHVLRVEVAARSLAHGLVSSGSTRRLSDVTPADRAAATARATTP